MALAGCSGESTNSQEPTPSEPQAAAAAPEPPLDGLPGTESADRPVRVTLFFADDSGGLTSEVREMPRVEPAARMARQIVEALVQGPRRGGARAIPADTEVRAVHLSADGTAFVDLDQAFSRGLSLGSEDALIAVRSLVETLAANLADVRRVKILVEGEEVRDLGGHLDLSRPLVPEGRPEGTSR